MPIPSVNVTLDTEISLPSGDPERVGAVIGTAAGTVTKIGTVPGGTATGAMSTTYAADITLPQPMKAVEPSILRAGQTIPAGRVCTVSGTLNGDGTRNCTVVDTLTAVAANSGAKLWLASDVSNNAVREWYGDGALTEGIEQTLLKGGSIVSVWGWKTDSAGVSTTIAATIDLLRADVLVQANQPTKILIADEVSGATAAALATKQQALYLANAPLYILAPITKPSAVTKSAYLTATISGYAAAISDGLGLTALLYTATDAQGARTSQALALGIFGSILRNGSWKEVGEVGVSENAIAELAALNVTDTVKFLTDSELEVLDSAQFIVPKKYDGIAGYYVANDWTRSSNSSKRRAPWLREGYKLVRALRTKSLSEINQTYVTEGGTISRDEQLLYEARRQEIVSDAVSNGEISRGTYSLTSVSAAGLFKGQLRFEPLGIKKAIEEKVVLTFDV